MHKRNRIFTLINFKKNRIMKKIILSIRRNRTFKAKKLRLEIERIEDQKSPENYLDDLKDLSRSEFQSVNSYRTEYIINDDCIRSI